MLPARESHRYGCFFLDNSMNNDISQALKEMQPKLQFTEEQYNTWATKKTALLIEFGNAEKTASIHVDMQKIKERSSWIAFEEFDLITSSGFKNN